uniref:Genome polyprotein n=1 Tax=Cuerna arida TaxID=1464854 RepID=A0A1B6F1I8_9HEMI
MATINLSFLTEVFGEERAVSMLEAAEELSWCKVERTKYKKWRTPATFIGPQSPADRRRAIGAYLEMVGACVRGRGLTKRIAELRKMLRHGENWFFPIYEEERAHVRFLLSRAQYTMSLRQKTNRHRRAVKTEQELLCELLDQLFPELPDSEGWEIDDTPYTPRPTKRREVPLPKWDKSTPVFKAQVVRKRDQILLRLLRQKIAALAASRHPSRCLLPNVPFKTEMARYFNRLVKQQQRLIAQHQGNEDAHGGEESQIQDQASNVVLERQTDESEGLAPKISTDKAFKLGSNDDHQQYDSFLNRFLHVKTVEWRADKKQGDVLFKEVFPKFIVKERGDTPNMSFFKLFQYWKGDMEFKIQINSNPFQVGQLQCSWRYMDMVNKNVKYYENVQSLSQTTHALASANSSNAVKIYVPYKFVKTSVATTERSDLELPLDLGTLRIVVLNQLHATESCYPGVDVSIWVRFLNGSFSGMKSSSLDSLASHQGWLDDIGKAEFHLNIDGKIDNTDKPPVQLAKSPYVVSSNQSFCAGTNITEPLNALRLDAMGQTQSINSGESETKISKLANIFGYVRTLTWACGDASQKLLTKIDASPMFNLNEYAGGVIKSDRYYNLPPVAVISEQFLYWRGSLELRLDIIATDFHRGKLMVAYIPRAMGDVTYKQALSSPHVVFDLREKKQFSMVVPWITNVHYWQRRFGTTDLNADMAPPGRIYIFVQNRLIPMDNVRDRVDINIYWRGGDDFSVAVPALSALSLPWNAYDNKQKVEVRASEAYYPYYVGQWRNFGGAFHTILRYGTGMDHVSQFEGFPTDTTAMYFEYTGHAPLKAKIYDSTTQQYVEKTLKFGVNFALDGFNYMAIAESEDQCKRYLDYQKFPSYKRAPADALPIIRDDDTGTWGGQENPAWIIKYYTPVPPEPNENAFVLVEHQGDERESVEAPSANLTFNTFYESGRGVFGENFVDFKDMARRYQPYCDVSFSIKDSLSIDAMVPVQPWGLPIPDLKQTSKSTQIYQIYNREGFIPILCSAYQFFRGGLRFKLVMQGKTENYGNFVVMHYPERHDIADLTVPGAGTIDSVPLSNYGYYIQSIEVNNIIEFEIPYYIPLNSIFPNPCNDEARLKLACKLGSIAMGCTATKLTKGLLFYSFADDTELTCFQGWPSMILRHVGFETNKRYAQHQGIFDSFKKVVSGDKPIHLKLDLSLEDFMKTEEYKEFKELLKGSAESVCSCITSQVGHLLLNPNRKTMAWAIVSVLIELKIFKIEFITMCMKPFEKLYDLFQKILTKDGQPDHTDGPGSTAQHQGLFDEEDNPLWEVVSLILGVLGLCLGMKLDHKLNPRNCAQLFSSFFKNLYLVARAHERILKFIKYSVELVRRLIQYVVLWRNPERILELMARAELPTLQLWSVEAKELLDIQHEEKIYTRGSVWSQRLEVNYALGCKIHTALMACDNKTFDVKLFQGFSNLFKSICEKRDQMYRRGVSVVSRKDPFCIYFAGPPGIGKSVMASDFCCRLIRDLHIPLVGEPIFTLPNGAKYWNGCRNQPVILIDDFLSVNKGTIQEEAIKAFMEIKSPAILNPSMAHLQDKELRYCPEILCVLANNAFPVVNHCNLEALYRRRDALCKVRLSAAVGVGVTRLSQLDRRQLRALNLDLANYEHLDFYIADDVTGGMDDENGATDEGAEFFGPLTFRNAYHSILDKIRDHRAIQEELYNARLARLQELYDHDAEVPATLGEKFQEYRRLIELLSMLNPRENCDFKDYLYLIQRAAQNLPVSDEVFERVVQIEANTRARFAEFVAAQQQNGQHQGFVDEEDEFGVRHLLDITKDRVQYCKVKPMKFFDSERHEIKSPKDLAILKSYMNIQCCKQQLEEALAEAECDCELELRSDPYGNDYIAVTLRDSAAVQVNWAEPKYNRYVKIIAALANNQEFVQGIKDYNNLVAEMNEVHRRLVDRGLLLLKCSTLDFNLEIPDDQMWRYFNFLIRLFSGSSAKHLLRFTHEIMAQFANIIKQPNCETYYKIALNKLATFGNPTNDKEMLRWCTYLTFNYILISVTEERMLQLIEAIDKLKEDNMGLGMVDMRASITRKIELIKQAYEDAGHANISPETIRTSLFGDYNRGCAHCYLSLDSTYVYLPNAEGGGKKVWHTINIDELPDRRMHTMQIPDEPCESEAVDCPLRNEFWRRTFFNYWKRNNPTQLRIIKGLPDSEKPWCEQKATNSDYKWYEKLAGLAKSYWEAFKEIFVCIVPHLVYYLSILLFLVLIVAYLVRGCYALRDIYNFTFGTSHQSTYNSGPPSTAPKAQKFSNFFSTSGAGASHQGFTDEGSLVQSIRKATWYVSAVGDNRKFKLLALGNRHMLFMKHYYEFFNYYGYKVLNFSRAIGHGTFTCSMDVLEFNFNPQNSTGICTLPKQFVPVKNIYNRFQPIHDVFKHPSQPVFVEVIDGDVMARTIEVERRDSITIAASKSQAAQQLNDVWSYNYGGFGCCGSPIVDMKTQQIIAIHVAGVDTKRGYGEIFCRDSFSKLFTQKNLNREEPIYVNDEFEPPEKFEGEFEYLGKVDYGLEQHQSPHTQLQPSLVSHLFESSREPAPLSANDKRLPEGTSPLYSGVNNMFKVVKPFPPELVARAVDDLQNYVNAKCKPVLDCSNILTLKEAIIGIKGQKYYDAIDMSTSEGYPMSRFRPASASGKAWLFDINYEKETVGVNRKLLDMIKRDQQKRLNGTMVCTVHDDCLKDALIDKEKCSIPGKTRIFSISPVQFTIVFKQFYTHFLAAFKTNRLNLEHAVGIAPNGPEWGLLVRYLVGTGNSAICCGDYGNFGPTLESNCLLGAFQIIRNWFKFNGCNNESFDLIRDILAQEVTFAVHLCSHHMYRVRGGMPSGNPATVELNSLVNMLYLRVAWLDIMSQGEYRYFLDSYYFNIRTVVYGDDIIFSVSDDVKELFNNDTLSKFFAKYNIKYTSVDKLSNETIKYETLSDATFLKRGFRAHPLFQNEYLAPLPKRIVYDTCLWVHKNLDLVEGTKESVIACCSEAYGLGPCEHGQLRNTLSAEMSRLGHVVSLRTWKEWDTLFFSSYYK